VRLFHNKDTKRIFVQVDDGGVLEYILGEPLQPVSALLSHHFLPCLMKGGPEKMPHLEDRVFEFKGPGGQPTTCPWVATAVVASQVGFYSIFLQAQLCWNFWAPVMCCYRPTNMHLGIFRRPQ